MHIFRRKKKDATPSRPSTPESRSHDSTMVILTNVISALDMANELVPLDIAKSVLSTLSSILTLVKNTMQNKEDFVEIISRCDRIAKSIERSTHGRSTSEINPRITQALDELKSVVDGIEKTLKAKEQRALTKRAFSASVDQGSIAKWKDQLDFFLRCYDVRALSNKTMRFYSILPHPQSEMITYIAVTVDRPSGEGAMEGKSDEPEREPPPARPPMLFGRDTLIQDVVESLNSQHVVLVGPGGIGKSSIAKAILNEDSIVAGFNDRRFFVRFDNINASQVTFDTFIGLIARTLGVRSNRLSSITTFLGASNVLLVFDNAETFQDAASGADRIAEVIEDFGALPTVTIMFTTRNRRVPMNLRCTMIDVPALEPNAARNAFTHIYHANGPPAIIDKLLSDLDFHPLSINILAHVARRNQWTLEELMRSWEGQHTHLLDAGDGKRQSLSVTIELSLTSSSIQRLGPDARHVMQVAAFLPQGLNGRYLEHLFPTVPNIHSIVGALCRLSLMYRKKDAYTMLSPIRLHISSAHKDDYIPSLDLTHVRAYYYEQLAQVYGEDDGGAWITAEDANLERLLAHDLSHVTPMDMGLICLACCQFIRQLRQHKCRPTSLRAVILGLPEGNPRPTKFLGFFKYIRQPLSRNAGLYGKADCAFQLASLAVDLINVTESVDLFATAKQLFTINQRHEQAALCLEYMGSQYTWLGKISAAEDTLQDALTMRREHHILSSEDKARINLYLGDAMMYRGRLEEARVLLTRARRYFQDVNNTHYLSETMQWQGEVELRSGNYLAARQHFEALFLLPTFMGNANERALNLILLSVVEVREGKISEAQKLLEKASALVSGGKEFYTAYSVLLRQGALASDGGGFDLAGDFLYRVFVEVAAHGGQAELAVATYYSARNELFAQDYRNARDLFSRALEYFDELSDMKYQVRCVRALGEIALLEKDFTGANMRFAKAKSLCDETGMHPDFLYNGLGFSELKTNHEGWKLFLEGHLPSS
ncbi:hypothetical protein BJ138DRAFT_1106974 [Hygrophoropsis aurantiaca]|uniref:Uncharacterized protein n=1 Tax=Hygrophoropsis aurantiaca TaxID=72124 RepID=A0ACB7ZST8_9AGAM|nr:hypothetical protein BJ138DRAFT_1106974 [Hygrophoropsis aurantiaca]